VGDSCPQRKKAEEKANINFHRCSQGNIRN